jgi:hypothetical protein
VATARGPVPIGAREVYALKLREMINRYCRDVEMLAAAPWPTELARAERGHTIECHGWQCGLEPGRWRLDADGTVTRLG